MHSPSCLGTFLVIRGVRAGRPPSGHRHTKLQPGKPPRDFSFESPVSPRDIGGLS
jgi:hypothetical protein